MGDDMAIISQKYGFAFVANPKAASTSIHAALHHYHERPELDALERREFYTRRHVPASQLMEILGVSKWERFLTFAVIRNPYDWLASQLAYNFQKAGMTAPTDRRISPDDVQVCLSLLRHYRGIEASRYATQWAFVCSDGGRLAVDLLLPFDLLGDIWPHLIGRLGLTEASQLPHLNTSSHPHWKDWLSPATKSLVAQLWNEDLRLYDSACATGWRIHD